MKILVIVSLLFSTLAQAGGGTVPRKPSQPSRPVHRLYLSCLTTAQKEVTGRNENGSPYLPPIGQVSRQAVGNNAVLVTSGEFGITDLTGQKEVSYELVLPGSDPFIVKAEYDDGHVFVRVLDGISGERREREFQVTFARLQQAVTFNHGGNIVREESDVLVRLTDLVTTCETRHI